MSPQKRYRCAVYTRKSHEEGLDQDFNSLDAQAESCKAYITSQTGLGWVLRDGSYNDAGILAGLINDADGHRLVPHHANKKGRRYHYYVSQHLKTGDQDTGWRVPMRTLEQIVQDTLVGTFCSKASVLDILPTADKPANEFQNIVSSAKALGDQIEAASHRALKEIYNGLIDTITLRTDHLSIVFKTECLSQRLGTSFNSPNPISLNKPMTIRRRGQEMKMVIGGQTSIGRNPDPVLIKLVVKAHLLKTELENKSVSSIKDFAAKYQMDHGDAKNLMPLAYLAPSIIDDILTGHQPADMNARRLKYLSDLPILWADQRAFLGFS